MIDFIFNINSLKFNTGIRFFKKIIILLIWSNLNEYIISCGHKLT